MFTFVYLTILKERRKAEFLLFKEKICKYINHEQFIEWFLSSNQLFILTPFEMYNLYKEEEILEKTNTLTKPELYDTLFTWS